MGITSSFMQRVSITRRKFIGSMLVGAGALLSACKMKSLGESTTNKGYILLDRIPSYPLGLKDAIQFPLLEALEGRRSRRFALGNSISDGPFAFTSRHDPIPLTELEQTLLLTTVGGNTGWQFLIPYNRKYLPNIPNYSAAAGGRTFPSGAGFHTTEFFFTDDNGTYFFPTRDAPSLLERGADGEVDLNKYLNAHRSLIRKLSDARLHTPAVAQHMEAHNTWCANRPGSTLIIPVSDLAEHHILNLCYIVQNGACIFDDINKRRIPGIERFKHIVDIENPYPLTFFEQISLTEATVENSTACYAGMLMLQAMGLGGWMYEGINPFTILGASGDPEVPGLGFRYDTDERWPLPNVTGLSGVFEGHCPPHYKDMRAAVDAVVQRKFGKGGPFNSETPGPFHKNSKIRGSAKIHDEEFKDCVTTMAQYVYDQFGRCPGTTSSMFMMMFLQAYHLDLEFYDKHFKPGSYLRTHAQHMKQWHSSDSTT